MKQFLAVLAAALVVITAHAQLGNPGSFTVAVNGTATSNNVGVISLAQSTTLSIQLASVNTTANISNTIVSIDNRVGAGAWKTTGKTMTIANLGTISATCVSNWTSLADAEWRLNVENAGLDTVTNSVTIRYAIKPGN